MTVTTGIAVLSGTATKVRKSDGTLVRLEDLSSGGGGGTDLSNYYTKGETDIRLAFKQHLLDNTAGSGSTLLTNNLLRRLQAGSNISIVEDADGNLVIASTGAGGSIPASIATFDASLVTLKVASQINQGLTVTNGLDFDIALGSEVRAHTFTSNGATTVSLNGTETSQLFCSADALGSSLIKALNRPNEQGCVVKSNTASAHIVLKNSTGQKKHQITCPWNFVHRQCERSSFVCGGHQHYSSKEPQRARVVLGDGDNVRTAALDWGHRCRNTSFNKRC